MSKLREIVADVLGVPAALIDGSSGPHDFVRWDSAAHVDIIRSLETEYGVAFSVDEMVDALSVSLLEDFLVHKGVCLK